MTYDKRYAVPLGDAVNDYGISKRTLTRRIADGTISQSQTFMRDGKRFIHIAELIRVFGEPTRKRPETDTAEGAPATTAGGVMDASDRAELIAELRERAKRAEALADAERERADRYEQERDDLRRQNDDLVTRLLPPPVAAKRPGVFRRMFGG